MKKPPDWVANSANGESRRATGLLRRVPRKWSPFSSDEVCHRTVHFGNPPGSGKQQTHRDRSVALKRQFGPTSQEIQPRTSTPARGARNTRELLERTQARLVFQELSHSKSGGARHHGPGEERRDTSGRHQRRSTTVVRAIMSHSPARDGLTAIMMAPTSDVRPLEIVPSTNLPITSRRAI